jgi:hypothetical protein
MDGCSLKDWWIGGVGMSIFYATHHAPTPPPAGDRLHFFSAALEKMKIGL